MALKNLSSLRSNAARRTQFEEQAAEPREHPHGREESPPTQSSSPLRARKRLALRAMPVAAAIERDALVAIGVTLLDMPAQPAQWVVARGLVSRGMHRLTLIVRVVTLLPALSFYL